MSNDTEYTTHRDIQQSAASANTEADVFIILRSSQDTIVAMPLWECQDSHAELIHHATHAAMRWADVLSEGEVTAQIIDKRPNAA
jgi:hypothetical protein